MTKLEELENNLSYKELQRIKRNVESKNFYEITTDERSLLILNYYSLAFIQVGAIIDASECLKILAYDKELDFLAKKNLMDARKRDLFVRLKKLTKDASYIKNTMQSVFKDSSLFDILISANEDLETLFNTFAEMPYPKRMKAIKIINSMEKDEEIIDLEENAEAKELMIMFAKANIKKDFLTHCQLYFKY